MNYILWKMQNYSSEDGRLHTGSASNFCGLNFVNYDVYVDIDNIAEGLEQVLSVKPEFAHVLTEGWENCTLNHTSSLLEDQSKQDHSMNDFGNKNNKLVMYDSLFCDPINGDAQGIHIS